MSIKKFYSIIVEDEEYVAKNIEISLQKLPFIEIVAIADNLQIAKEEILFSKPDLLFLDIEVQGKSVFSLLKSLEKRNLKFGIVFITANYHNYIEEAVETCGINYPFAYLAKPFLEEKLIQVLNNIRRKLTDDKNDYIIFDLQGAKLRFLPDEIFYCETEGNYSIIYTTDGRKEMITKNLKTLHQRLPKSIFYRLSGQYIINKAYVKKGNINMNVKKCTIIVGDRKEDLVVPDGQWRGFLKNCF